MDAATVINFNINAGALIVSILVFSLSLLGIIWKAKSEINATLKEEIGPLKLSFTKTCSSIIEIQSILKSKLKGISITHNILEISGSPLRPTEFGAELIKLSGLEQVLDQYNKKLITMLKGKLPSVITEYDVQENARNLLVALKDNPMMTPIKKYLYNNPSVKIEELLQLGGLWLRDDFLKQPRAINKLPELNNEN